MIHRIYVAGPYCVRDGTLHDAPRITQHNVDRAIEIGNRLIELGHYVFVPHLSHYMHIHPSCKRDYDGWWYDEDNTFLDHWATAFYYISSSVGADAELIRAKGLGLKIFYTLSEVPNLKEGS